MWEVDATIDLHFSTVETTNANIEQQALMASGQLNCRRVGALSLACTYEYRCKGILAAFEANSLLLDVFIRLIDSCLIRHALPAQKESVP